MGQSCTCVGNELVPLGAAGSPTAAAFVALTVTAGIEQRCVEAKAVGAPFGLALGGAIMAVGGASTRARSPRPWRTRSRR